MKGKRFADEQIIRISWEAEAVLSVTDVCRKHNYSEQRYYRWKAMSSRDPGSSHLRLPAARRRAPSHRGWTSVASEFLSRARNSWRVETNRSLDLATVHLVHYHQCCSYTLHL